MTRFYAMIANGGYLVTPHVVSSVEEPGSPNQPGKVLQQFNPQIPTRVFKDSAALSVVRDGLYRATHASYGTATSVFGSFPIPIAGKTGTAEEIVQPAGYSKPLLQDQSWWCGYRAHRHEEARPRRLRRDRERRPRRDGRGAGRPEDLRALLPREGAGNRADLLRLMADVVVPLPESRARARARRRELTQAAPIAARLDWIMLLAVAAIVAFGLYAMAGITRDDWLGDPTHFLYRQFVFVAVGVVALSVAVLVDPDIYRRSCHLCLAYLLYLPLPLPR